jgi:hypothetical protein
MIVIISKVQVRRGLEVELPGGPITLDPISLSAGLEVGELGFTKDTSRLFIGFEPTPAAPNYLRSVFPYQNVEVLTESSPRIQELFANFIMDQDETDFFVPTLINIRSMADITYPAETLNPAQLTGSIVSAIIDYHAFSTADGTPVKQGTLRIVADQSTQTISDTENVQLVSGLTFGLRKDSSGAFFMLQCQNSTAASIDLYLRRVVVTGG